MYWEKFFTLKPRLGGGECEEFLLSLGVSELLHTLPFFPAPSSREWSARLARSPRRRGFPFRPCVVAATTVLFPTQGVRLAETDLLRRGGQRDSEAGVLVPLVGEGGFGLRLFGVQNLEREGVFE